MKQFLLGSIVGAASVLACLSAVAYGVGPTLFAVHLIANDAAGRTFQATAAGNSLTYSGAPTFGGSVVTLEITTDQILCSSFGQ